MIEKLVLELMEQNKAAVKYWNIEKILKTMKVDNVKEAIQICLEKIKTIKYSTGTDWQGKTKLYYHIENENILLSLEKSDLVKNYREKYYFDFKNDEEKLQVLFEISGELSTLEKFEF